MEKKIVVCIGTDRVGNVRARLSLIILEGGRVQAEHYHSVSLAAGDDIDATRAAVENHIARDDARIPFAPWPKIPDAEWAKVDAVCRIFHKTVADPR